MDGTAEDSEHDQEAHDSYSDSDDDDNVAWGPSPSHNSHAREVKRVKVIEPHVEFTGDDGGGIISFYKCHFKDTTLTFSGTEVIYVFEKCVWNQTRLRFMGNANTFIFEDTVMAETVLIGGDGELTIENMTSNECIMTTNASFFFGEHPIFHDVCHMELEDDTDTPSPTRVFQAEVDEQVDFIKCRLYGNENVEDDDESDETSSHGEGNQEMEHSGQDNSDDNAEAETSQ